jgi:hypothetical protein
MIRKGLQWLAAQQKLEGHWSATGGQYRVAMTALAGLAFVREGSTAHKGKYAEQIRRASEWLLTRVRKGGAHDGLIGDPGEPSEAVRYMFGHGFAMQFLAEVVGEEDNRERRKRLMDVLRRAVKFSKDNQSERGGWFYTSYADSGGADEMAVTVVQLHALRAVRDAGIAVPREILKKGEKYLEKATAPGGGVVYPAPGKVPGAIGGGRPALTAGALACVYPEGARRTLWKKWLVFCRDRLPLKGSLGMSVDEFAHYFYAPVVWRLGDNGWARLFPDSRPADRVTWTGYRAARFDWLMRQQNADGSWSNGGVGPVYSTAMHLLVLQLDNTVLPLTPR